MGKTEDGAIWLNRHALSPIDYWQFWRNTDDADVGKFLKLFTILPLKEIAKLEKLRGAEINDAKKILATEATRFLHGKFWAQKAEEAAKNIYEENTISEHLETVQLNSSLFRYGVSLDELMYICNMRDSKSETRKLIKNGGAYVNNEKILDPKYLVCKEHFENDLLKISAGKKKHILVKII